MSLEIWFGTRWWKELKLPWHFSIETLDQRDRKSTMSCPLDAVTSQLITAHVWKLKTRESQQNNKQAKKQVKYQHTNKNTKQTKTLKLKTDTWTNFLRYYLLSVLNVSQSFTAGEYSRSKSHFMTWAPQERRVCCGPASQSPLCQSAPRFVCFLGWLLYFPAKC